MTACPPTRPIAVPFHDGRLNFDRGRGPSALLAAAGISAAETVATPNPDAPEAARIFGVAVDLAARVRTTRAGGTTPIVLAGDCNSCLGTVAGCTSSTDESGLGVVWLDAHGDFETNETSTSGTLDGMGLRMLTGVGWDKLRTTIPGLAPVAEQDVVLIGARALGRVERASLDASAVTVLPGTAWSRTDAVAALDRLRRRVERVYLHIDLDVLDPSVGRANHHAEPGGFATRQVLDIIDLVAERFDIAAAALTAYDPEEDTAGTVADAGADMLTMLRQLTPRLARRTPAPAIPPSDRDTRPSI